MEKFGCFKHPNFFKNFSKKVLTNNPVYAIIIIERGKQNTKKKGIKKMMYEVYFSDCCGHVSLLEEFESLEEAEAFADEYEEDCSCEEWCFIEEKVED